MMRSMYSRAILSPTRNSRGGEIRRNRAGTFDSDEQREDDRLVKDDRGRRVKKNRSTRR
jgi:hypothetical protein